MDVRNFNVNVCSEQPERLIRFYADVVGLPKIPQIGPGAFRVGGAAFLVDGHSEVRGAANEPQRILLTFSVADVPGEQARLEAAGVAFVRPATKEPWGGYVATFTIPTVTTASSRRRWVSVTAAIDTITLHFVRHGETEFNAERRFQHPETPLSARGRDQAAVVAEALAGLNAEMILASDYARAFETANIIAKRVNLPVTVEPALRERNFGVLRGQLYAELGEEYVRSVYTGWNTGVDEGESWSDVHDRVAAFFARLRSAPPAREMILVTHGGALNVALHCLRGAPEDAFALERFENCAVRTVTLSRV